MSDGPEWFAPKRYGYGSGLPIAWQGWAVLLAYIALIGLASFILSISVWGYAAFVVTLTAFFVDDRRQNDQKRVALATW